MTMRLSLSAIALLAGVGIAAAQQQAPADPQGHDPMKSQQGGKEEPGSHSSGAPTNTVFVDGKLAVPGAPADSQTVPSKVSARNAKLDALPIMAMPLGLSDEQKRRILDSVAKSNIPIEQISAKPADMLPQTTQVSQLPDDVKAAMPMVSDFSIIRTKDKILLMRPPNMVVTGEIATE